MIVSPVALGMVAAAVVSAAFYWLVHRFFAAHGAMRYGEALAFATAFALGFGLATEWEAMAPQRHWHWIGWLTLLAAFAGPIAASPALLLSKQTTLKLLATLISAVALVPNWPDLTPSRPICLAVLTVYLFLLTILLERLATRLNPSLLLAQMALTSAGLAVLILVFYSVSYAGLVGVSAAALVGCWLSSFGKRQHNCLAALGLAYSVNVGGWAFVAWVNPRPPLLGMLIVPLAPLAFWCCGLQPVSRLGSVSRACWHPQSLWLCWPLRHLQWRSSSREIRSPRCKPPRSGISIASPVTSRF